MSKEEKHLFELICYGLQDEGRSRNSVKEELIRHFQMHEAEADLLLNGEYRMYPLYRDQALHFAKEFSHLGIRTEIRKKNQ